MSIWKIILWKLSFPLSTGVKWCQFEGKDLLICIRSVALWNKNVKTTFQEGGFKKEDCKFHLRVFTRR